MPGGKTQWRRCKEYLLTWNYVLTSLHCKFNLVSIMNAMADMDDENEPPKIKLGDASGCIGGSL